MVGFIVEKPKKQHLKNVNIEFTPSNVLFNTTSATTNKYGEFKTKLITNQKYMVEIRQNNQQSIRMYSQFRRIRNTPSLKISTSKTKKVRICNLNLPGINLGMV